MQEYISCLKNYFQFAAMIPKYLRIAFVQQKFVKLAAHVWEELHACQVKLY